MSDTSSTVCTEIETIPFSSGYASTDASARNGCARRMRSDSERLNSVHGSPGSSARKRRMISGLVVAWSCGNAPGETLLHLRSRYLERRTRVHFDAADYLALAGNGQRFHTLSRKYCGTRKRQRKDQQANSERLQRDVNASRIGYATLQPMMPTRRAAHTVAVTATSDTRLGGVHRVRLNTAYITALELAGLVPIVIPPALQPGRGAEHHRRRRRPRSHRWRRCRSGALWTTAT